MSKPPRTSDGMVTAELALGLLSVSVIVVVMACLAAVLILQVRCIDTAAEVARQAARGDMAAVRRAESDAPARAQVSLKPCGASAQVTVELKVRLLGVLPSVPLRAQAQVLCEPGAR